MTEEGFAQKDGYIWYDGEFVKWQDTKIHILTHGLHYASCVFEGERAYNGHIFKSQEHSQRLHDSAQMLGITIPYTIEDIEKAKYQLLEKQNLKDAYLRAVVWRGSEKMGLSARHNRIHLAIAAWSWPSYFSVEQRKRGLTLNISQWRRPSPETAPCHAKASGLYMICTLSKHSAEEKGFDDALMLDYRGLIAEATGANIFFIKDNVIHTPLPDCFLNGITRQTVITLAKEKGLQVCERHIPLEELGHFEQCFLTGTAAEITPVRQICDQQFIVGDLILDLMERYKQLTHAI